jgi:mannose-6-phosphate isomerase-like protein (cupin superfamily)
MARRVVKSEPTDDTFVFDDDWNEPDGRVRRLEFTLGLKGRVPPHAHPATAESFEVTSGVLSLKIGGRTLKLGPGEKAGTSRGEVHSLWNEGPEVAYVISSYDPPLAVEPFFTAIPRAQANPFKMAVLWAESRRVSQPKAVGLRIFIALFGTLGRLAGLSGWSRPELSQTGRSARREPTTGS